MADSIKILVTGKSGSGKSILANGIFGKEVVGERHGIRSDVRSSEIDFYTSTIDGVRVEVWVSSSLQDEVAHEETYLPDLKKKCSDVDLILYCIKMSNSRFVRGNPDAQAMYKLTQTLGVDSWRKTIFVLTHANVAASITYTPEMFRKQIASWKNVLCNTLADEAYVPREIGDGVRVVPTGHYNVPKLPDRDYWLSGLWSECCETFSTPEVRRAMIKINLPRLKMEYDVSDKDFTDRKISDQPIVVNSEVSRITNIRPNKFRMMQRWNKVKWPLILIGVVTCTLLGGVYDQCWLSTGAVVLTCGLALVSVMKSWLGGNQKAKASIP